MPSTPRAPRLGGDRVGEVGDELDRVLDLELEIGRERPIGIAELAPDQVEDVVEPDAPGRRPHRPAARASAHNARRRRSRRHARSRSRRPSAVTMHRLAQQHHAAHLRLDVIAQPFVVVARHVDDLGALARLAQQLLHHVVVLLRPVPRFAQPPAIDHVADEIEIFRFVVAQEIEQKLGLAAARAEMHVGNPDGAVAIDARRAIHLAPHRSLTRASSGFGAGARSRRLARNLDADQPIGRARLLHLARARRERCRRSRSPAPSRSPRCRATRCGTSPGRAD